MENYLENYKKNNKLLFKYLGYSEKEVDYKNFAPHNPIVGFEILRWVMHKINHNPRNGCKMRIIVSMRDEESEIYIQEWHDTTKSNGYVTVVHHKEFCQINENDVDKKTYEDEVINVSHKAAYNACVDFIIKTT